MPLVREMLNEWTDADFDYDREYDLFVSEQKHIRRPDGVTLYCVSELKHGAKFTVHLCAKATEIWAVNTAGLRSHIWNDEGWEIAYSPRSKNKGLPTARGYLIPCQYVKQFGHCFNMPGIVRDRLLSAATKDEAGRIAQDAFTYLVKTRFFPAIFVPPIRPSEVHDDICCGIDVWVGADVPVQVKYDGPGGRNHSGFVLCGGGLVLCDSGTGNLFFQTHTLPLRDCKNWHEYQYPTARAAEGGEGE